MPGRHPHDRWQSGHEADRWLGKPVIAITSEMLWHAIQFRGAVEQGGYL